jgi:gag-polypeptide of LTR copia-type
MNAPIPDALAVIMFLSSLQGHFEATVAAIRSISDDNLTWDDVTSRLIEEASPRSRTRQDSALAVHSRPICSFCGRQGHEANRCFTNPSNPNNRLGTLPSHPSSQRSGPNRRLAMVHAFDSNGPDFPPPSVQDDSPFPPPAAFAAAQHPPGASHGRGTRSYHLLVVRATTAVIPDPASARSESYPH